MEYIWYKLKDDTWGVKIKNGTGVAGQEIKVTNKAGKESTVVLAVQKAKFDDAELWAIKR